MKKVAVFIDGSNLHGCIGRLTGLHKKSSKLKDNEFYTLDFKKLQEVFLKDVELVKLFYARSETPSDNHEKKEFYRVLNNIGYKLDIKERKDGAKEKGVDMAIAMEMLIMAFNHYFDEAIIVGGDADYCQLTREVQRFGKRVGIAFFGEDYGLSNKLLNESDFFIDLGHKNLLNVKRAERKSPSP